MQDPAKGHSESKIQLPIFVIRNENKKHSSQPNLEIIYKRVLGKSWEQEVPLGMGMKNSFPKSLDWK